MHAVPQLMRERHHVARLALIVEQDIRVRRRRRRMRERARRLARAHRRIDPASIEETLGDFRHLRRESAVGGQHRVARLDPTHNARGHLRQRRIAIP